MEEALMRDYYFSVGEESFAKILRGEPFFAPCVDSKPTRVWYQAMVRRVCIQLSSACIVAFEARCIERLAGFTLIEETNYQLLAVELSASGLSLVWRALGIELSIPDLMAGQLGGAKWMEMLASFEDTPFQIVEKQICSKVTLGDKND
jgi:hypothetical protein